MGYVKDQTLAVDIGLTEAAEVSIRVAKTPCPGS
jgi:hypothetical protein